MRKTLLVMMLLCALPHYLQGQSRLSEKGTVTQIVSGTTITIEYYRPTIRGRTDIFGKQVHWGEIWTPGANWSTTFETDRDIDLNGQRVPKGKYSVWMITAKDSAWTFFLNKNARRFHTFRPKDTSEDVVRFQVQPTTGASMETLLWYFPRVEKESATLHMHWANTIVALDIVTVPLPQLALTAEQRRAYVGEYQVVRVATGDTAKALISEENGKLYYTSSVGSANAMKTEFVAFAENTFRRMVPDGPTVQAGENIFVFTRESDGTMTFEAIGADDKKLFGRGRRMQ